MSGPGAPGDDAGRPPRVLVLARNHPNAALPLLGLWARQLVRCAAGFAEVKVVSPVPYAPPLPAVGPLALPAKLRGVPARTWDGEVEVFHPRMLLGPGSTTLWLESVAYAAAVLPVVASLRRRFTFDVVHAHFTYPDGVVAALVGRHYGVPVVISEHVPWLAWMKRRGVVRRQTLWASRAAAAHVPVSRYVARTIAETDGAPPVRWQPLTPAVDGHLFRPIVGLRREREQILFVGAVRHVKGADVLLEALSRLRRERPGVRLVLAGDPFYRSYRRDAERILTRASALGLSDCLEVVGGRSPEQVARLMAESAVLVVPSRAESFGAVVIEALACGTPVVATRCGGPEEIVTPRVGRLVPTEDPDALAAALGDVLDDPDRYEPAELRGYALERFGAEAVQRRLAAIYGAVRGTAPTMPDGRAPAAIREPAITHDIKEPIA